MKPASLAVLKRMTSSGPMKKPSTPKSFKPMNIAISVGNGDSPI